MSLTQEMYKKKLEKEKLTSLQKQMEMIQLQRNNQERLQFRRNQEDIDRAKLLYNQKYIDQNYKQVDLNLDDDEEDDEEDEEDEEDNNISDIGLNLQRNKFLPSSKKTYQESQHFIVISSLDRNWEEDEPNTSQYNFQLKFSPSGNTISNRPMYYNNPTIPANFKQSSQGLLGDINDSGWFGEDGTFYPAYRPDLPPGEIVQYEKIVEKGQKGLSLNNSFKNITSIELLSAMMPSVQRQIDYHPTLTDNTIEETYYSIEIEEIKDVMQGTSRDLNNAFAIITPIIRIYDIVNTSSKSVEYKVAGMWSKKFSPAPLSSLNNLTMTIKKPSGDIVSNLNDILDIKYIYQSNLLDDDTNFLVIETLQYFSDTEYKNTDTLIIRNFQYHDNTILGVQYFNEFMNRQKGHKIIKTDKSNSNKLLKNLIYIARPAYLDKNIGELVEEDWYTSFKTNIWDINSSEIIEQYDTGRLINIDLQNIYFFKITTKETNITIESERV